MRRWVVGAFLTILITAVMPAAWGQDLEYVGSTFWTGISDVKIVGSYAYCAYVNGLAIFDISDPANPQRNGQAFLSGTGKKLAVSGGYAYVADGSAGLQILDISDISRPIPVGAFEVDWPVNDVFVSGRYAFITYDRQTDSLLFRILDISSPANPVLVGFALAPAGYWGVSIYVAGNYAYVGTWDGYLVIYDIADPQRPLFTANLLVESPGSNTRGLLGISTAGNYIYIAASGGLYIVDASNPASPVIIAQSRQDSYSDVDIEGIYAYATGANRLYVYDISDPGHLDQLSFTFTNHYHGLGIDVMGGIACVAAEEYLQVYDVSNPDSMFLQGAFGYPNSLNAYDDIAVSGNYAYIPHSGKLRIVDVTDQANPIYLDSCAVPARTNRVFVTDNYAYTTGSDSGLGIVNISDPHSPFMAGVYIPQSSSSPSVFVQGSYAYLSTGLGLEILNVDDPPHPILVGHYWRLGSAFVQGSYAYLIVSPENDFQVINIADPANPILVGEITSIGGSGPPFVIGNYAYLRIGSAIAIIDISNPAEPAYLASYSTRTRPSDIFVSGHYVYVAIMGLANKTGGVDVIDVGDPLNPLLSTSFILPGYSHNIYVDENYCYLTTDYSMVILTANPTGIDDPSNFPATFALRQNYPNPFNARTTISYSLSKAGSVNLSIFNLLGERIETIKNSLEQAGPHQLVWDAKDIPSGVYFTRLETGGRVQTIKMVVLK